MSEVDAVSTVADVAQFTNTSIREVVIDLIAVNASEERTVEGKSPLVSIIVGAVTASHHPMAAGETGIVGRNGCIHTDTLSIDQLSQLEGSTVSAVGSIRRVITLVAESILARDTSIGSGVFIGESSTL